MVAGLFYGDSSPIGPPRPSVYCSRKCFGGQKPGVALKGGVSNQLRHTWIEREHGRGRERGERREDF